MIELHVSDNDVTSGSIAVTWCVTAETLDLLAKRKVYDPQIVICVSPEGENYNLRKEYRKVVSLKDLMAYVEFRVPGKNKITAVVSYLDHKRAKNRYLTKDRGEFDTHILDCDGEEYASWLTEQNDRNETLSEPIIVNVPQECFAPEPPAWEKTWVNHFFRSKPEDQCNYRRRRLFAYGVQPFIILVSLVARLVLLLVATLFGSRNWSLKYLLHPLTYDLGEAVMVLGGGSVFIRHLPEDDESGDPPNIPSYLVRSFWSLPFMPVILITLFLLWKFNVLMMAGFIVGGALLLVAMVAFFASGCAKDVLGVLVDKIARVLSYLERRSDKLWYMDQEEMAMIVCDGKKKAVDLSSLPAKKRTFSLRFHSLKSKVCRPFSA